MPDPSDAAVATLHAAAHVADAFTGMHAHAANLARIANLDNAHAVLFDAGHGQPDHLAAEVTHLAGGDLKNVALAACDALLHLRDAMRDLEKDDKRVPAALVAADGDLSSSLRRILAILGLDYRETLTYVLEHREGWE